MGFIVALLLALTVPVSQLRTVTIETSCCCPDPATCHCPDHGETKPDQAQLKACHQTTKAHVAPTLPAFAAPATVELPVQIAAPARVAVAHPPPHESPPPSRPDAPS